jgi:hypothetical protein
VAFVLVIRVRLAASRGHAVRENGREGLNVEFRHEGEEIAAKSRKFVGEDPAGAVHSMTVPDFLR